VSLTGVQRGQGWRTVPTGEGCFQYPAVVRILGLSARRREYVHVGSGTIIGSVENRVLIVATAAHNFEDLGDVLGVRGPPRPPGLPKDKSEDEIPQAVRERLRVGVLLGGRELILRQIVLERAKVLQNRDTALLFVEQPRGLRVGVDVAQLPVNLGNPPTVHETILVAGFGEGELEGVIKQEGKDEGIPSPSRRLIVREGFFRDFGRRTGQLQYALYRHGIPVSSGMSGGPVIHIRYHSDGSCDWCFAALNNISMRVEELRESEEVESFATSPLALWSHEVPLLPEGPLTPETVVPWISFAEAMARGMIHTHGPEVHRVVEYTRRDGMRERKVSSLFLPYRF
jgi:hypothetical protein